MRDLYITYARRRNVFGAESFGLRSRFIDEIPRELTDQPDRNAVGIGRPARPGRVASWATAAAASARETLGGGPGRGGDGAGGRSSAIGDDVVHAAFGEGVVTGRRARRDRRRPLRLRRLAAQADGRLRADPQALRRAMRAGRAATSTATATRSCCCTASRRAG